MQGRSNEAVTTVAAQISKGNKNNKTVIIFACAITVVWSLSESHIQIVRGQQVIMPPTKKFKQQLDKTQSKNRLLLSALNSLCCIETSQHRLTSKNFL